jgi:phospholipase/carboxylesterase
MKPSHTGMGITKEDYAAFMHCLSATLDTFAVPEPERGEVTAFITSLEPEIVEATIVTASGRCSDAGPISRETNQPYALKVNSSLTGVAMTQASHAHLFLPGSDPAKPPVVLLHGSGGNERDLLPLAGELSPGAPILAVRGAVPFDDGHAFFHRFPDRSVDEADIATRAQVLADSILAAITRYSFTRAPVAIGFSNGAIMAAALLLTRPSLLTVTILFRPLSPLTHDSPTRLGGKPVLIIDGEKDTRRSPGDGARLAERLIRAGATVTHHVLPIGHSITTLDRDIARNWLAQVS